MRDERSPVWIQMELTGGKPFISVKNSELAIGVSDYQNVQFSVTDEQLKLIRDEINRYLKDQQPGKFASLVVLPRPRQLVSKGAPCHA